MHAQKKTLRSPQNTLRAEQTPLRNHIAGPHFLYLPWAPSAQLHGHMGMGNDPPTPSLVRLADRTKLPSETKIGQADSTRQVIFNNGERCTASEVSI